MPTVNCGSRRWFHTPDGVPPYTPINGSSSKYFIQNDNNLLLNLTDVSASHEGIYGCSTNNEGYDLEVCVKVYGESCLR